MAALTEADVLRAVDKACAPWSNYIADYLRREQKARACDGSLVLARLRALEARGLLIRDGGPMGYYGYRWKITSSGRAALSEEAAHA